MHPNIYQTIAQAHIDDLKRAAAAPRIADGGFPGRVGLLGRLSVLARFPAERRPASSTTAPLRRMA
jgi:hypothetical protein